MEPAPPALREVGVREIAASRFVPGQVGNPPCVRTDALSGYSCAGRRCSEVPFTSCVDSGSELARPAGHESGRRSGKRKDARQKAKVGDWPCWIGVTHVALPPSFVLGSSCAIKAQGTYLLKEFGPCGGRTLAARRR